MVRRLVGLGVLASCAWWSWTSIEPLAFVSPVHWGLLAPQLAVALIPATLGAISGVLLVMGSRGGRILLLAFLFTALQATAVRVFNPGVTAMYQDTVERSRDSLQSR